MGDVTLVIDADTARAIRDLAKLSQAQDNLEKATKKLGETSQKQSQETTRVRVNESAALEKTYMNRRTAVMEAIKNEKELAKQTENAGKKTKDTSDSIFNLGGAAANAATSIIGMVGGLLSLQTVVSIVGQVETRLRNISDSSNQAARALRSVSIQMPGGVIGRKLTAGVALQGAQSGFTPEETGQVANVIQSIPGADLQKEMANAGILHNLGIAGADIAPVIQAGVVRGMGGQRAGDLATRASELAPLDVGTVARYLPKTLKYTSLEAGLAAGTTLKTAGVVDEQIPYAVEALGRALSEDKSPLAKKFGLKGLTESERIAKISAAADASGDRAAFIRALPEKYKTGEEEGRSLQAVLSRGGQFAADEAALKATQQGYAQTKLGDLMQDPLQRAEIEARAGTQVAAINRIYGPQGNAGRAQEARLQGLGAQIQTDMPWLAPFAVNEQGQANMLGQFFEPFMQGRAAEGGAAATRVSTMTPEQQRRETTAGMAAQTEKLITALDENTKATRENSTASGGDAPNLAARRNANQ